MITPIYVWTLVFKYLLLFTSSRLNAFSAEYCEYQCIQVDTTELKNMRNVSFMKMCQVLLRPGDQQEGVLPVCRDAAGGRGLEGEDPELSLVRCYLVRCYLVRSPGSAVSPAVTSYTSSSEYKHQRCSN